MPKFWEKRVACSFSRGALRERDLVNPVVMTCCVDILDGEGG